MMKEINSLNDFTMATANAVANSQNVDNGILKELCHGIFIHFSDPTKLHLH